MSMCSLRGLNLRLCRRAFILAQTTTRLPGTALTARAAHNSLYQMVKKRTLEARTKLQPTKFPNNNPCVAPQDPATSNTLCASSSSASSSVPPPPPSSSGSSSSGSSSSGSSSSGSSSSGSSSSGSSSGSGKPSTGICPTPYPRTKSCTNPAPTCASQSKTPSVAAQAACRAAAAGSPVKPQTSQDTEKCEPTKPKVCQNTQVLNANDCHTKPTCPGSKGADSGKGDSDADRKKKMLLWLLAALGAGGLLLWLLTRGKKDKCKDDKYKGIIVADPQSVPSSSAELPKHVPYLLIGGGTASFSAFRAIKSNDPKAKVLMITNEFRKPYMRPPLSKELWYSAQQGEVSKDYRFKQWTGAERSLYFEPEEFFVHPSKLMETVNGGIAVAQGFAVKKIDPAKRIATLKDGYEIGYDECLIATGCSPKNLPVFANAPISVREKVMVYRTPDDFERLKRYMDANKSITIIGNGFIGSELACSLANYSKDKGGRIYQVFQETGNMSKVLPDYLSKWTTQKVEALGVCVLPNASVREATRDETVLKLTLNNGHTILTDIAVVCVGCDPNTSLANMSGLEVDRTLGGFVVNAELEARRNLFVAGDASCFYDPLLGRRRVEHHDHSVVSGRLAGENMVGKKKAYAHQSMLWSDLGPEIGYEAIGLVDSCLPTVGVFALPSSKNDRSADNLTEKRDIDDIEKSPSKTDGASKDLPEIKCEPQDAENYGRGVVFYMRDDKIVGILLWNLFSRIGLARTIINQNKKFDDLNEVAKLFEIHS